MYVPLQVTEEDFFSGANQMSRWLERVLGPDYRRYRPRQSWSPAINFYEDAAAYFLVADLAGVQPDSINLRVAKGRLVLQGQRLSPRPPVVKPGTRVGPKALRLHLLEIDHGPFHRTLELPEAVAADRIEALYRNGLLWVKMPKGASAK